MELRGTSLALGIDFGCSWTTSQYREKGTPGIGGIYNVYEDTAKQYDTYANCGNPD